ncbi:MAG: lysine--tRNA ligase [Treponema sp.]|jgi:lysyl-tRNA synthetase class 1|nr:lysine--tRNA ligase [Treponema sp.]
MEKNAAAHWADETALRIIAEKGDKPRYTCASGITPSGTVHIGNFREIISVDLVVRALRDLGREARFIYSWDDYDVFRKTPANMPRREELSTYLRQPITLVPDPWGRDESYARHHEADVEAALPAVGIAPEYLYQAQRYRASVYAEGIKRALECREELRRILDSYRDDTHKIEGEWWPVSVFCGACNKDETAITGWDGDWGLGYRCASCGHAETVDLRHTGLVKLGWRIDWPMRWAFERVDFEPAGKDHHSQGGSFDTAKHIAKKVYGWAPPVSFRYDFIGIKGGAGKMSSSSGNVITLQEVLRVYTPDVARYLFASAKPNTEFTISFDLDVIKTYEEYDRTERIVYGAEDSKDEALSARARRVYELSQVETDAAGKSVIPAAMPLQVPFRHLCSLVQIAEGDLDRAIERFGGLEPARRARLAARALCAKTWVEEGYAPDEFRFRLRAPGETAALSEAERAGVRALRDQVVSALDGFTDDKGCAQAIYDAAASCGIDAKALFRAAYQALIGKDQGPRLAAFLRSIGRERLLALLAAY